MAAPARKRQRVNTSGDTSNPLPTAPDTDYKSLISTFDLSTTQSLLLSAAQHHPTVAQSILIKHTEFLAAERSRVIDFDHYSKSIWRALRDADKMSGSRAWEASFDVSSSIESAVEKMLKSAPAHASLGTKKSALYTLRKICKTVALGRNDTCGHEVYNTLTGEQTLENGMLDIIGGMSEEEKQIMRGDGEWVGKMEELEEMGDFDGIEDVLVEMGLGGSGEDDEIENESEDENESADNVDSEGEENIIGSRRCLFHADFGEKGPTCDIVTSKPQAPGMAQEGKPLTIGFMGDCSAHDLLSSTAEANLPSYIATNLAELLVRWTEVECFHLGEPDFDFAAATAGQAEPSISTPDHRPHEHGTRNSKPSFLSPTSHLSRTILMIHHTLQMPWHCQHWTIQQLISMRSSSSKEAEVLLWEENTKSQLQFVALAATLVAGVVGASVAWSAADEAHWLVLVLWYGSLVMSLYCVIIAFHLGILFSAFDIRPDRAERILDMLKQRDKDEPRWRSQWVLNMPIALFSWSVISYLVGLALLVVEPLWKVGWEKDGWIAIGFLVYFLLSTSFYFIVGGTIHGRLLPDLAHQSGVTWP
ncbi:MAG: hypothetical protein Q9176_005948 [Flavoplaca citrina]